MHRLMPVSLLYPFALGLEASCRQGLGRIPREALLLYDYQVELVFEEVGTG